MRVGALVNAIMFTVFALLWAVFQSLIISGLNSLATSVMVNGQQQAFDPSALAAAGLATCGCGYLLGVVFSAISGGIFGLLIAVAYNLVANWLGGLRVQLDGGEAEKRKREMGEPTDKMFG